MEYLLFICKDTDKYLNLVDRDFCLQDPPECLMMYLRAGTIKFLITNGVNVETWWAMRACRHVNKELQVVESNMKEDNIRWKKSKKTADHPFSRKYWRSEIYMAE